jgi:endonuclease YncB( thermonuclease family)
MDKPCSSHRANLPRTIGPVVLVLLFLAAACGGPPAALPAPPVVVEPTATLALPTIARATEAPPATAAPAPTEPPVPTAAAATAAPAGEPAPPAEGLVEVEVLEVIDGDTLRVALDGERVLVRYIGIDAPEPGQGYLDYEWLGPEASELNAALVAGGRVGLERDISETDRYNRLLRYVWVGDLLVNAEMVRQGYAQALAYPPDTRYAEWFSQLEDEARAAGLGIWGERPTATPETRASGVEIGAECAYIGNRNSKKFHEPGCSSVEQMNPENRVCLGSREEAIAGGYEPCGRCHP